MTSAGDFALCIDTVWFCQYCKTQHLCCILVFRFWSGVEILWHVNFASPFHPPMYFSLLCLVFTVAVYTLGNFLQAVLIFYADEFISDEQAEISCVFNSAILSYLWKFCVSEKYCTRLTVQPTGLYDMVVSATQHVVRSIRYRY